MNNHTLVDFFTYYFEHNMMIFQFAHFFFCSHYRRVTLQFCTSVEVIILHGTEDNKVPFEHGRRLAEIGHVPFLGIWRNLTDITFEKSPG